MGADIRLSCESYDTNYQKWIYQGSGYEDRSYVTFAVLAGVRNYMNLEHISESRGEGPELRGIPEDCSEELVGRYDDADYHSRHWLSLKELLEYDWDMVDATVAFTDKMPITIDGSYFEGFLTFIREELVPLGEPDKVRIVFCFDN